MQIKKSHHAILKYIFDHDDAGIREVSGIMERKYNDHHDFYVLAALVDAGYIEFTGPIYKNEDGSLETYKQVRLFQAYSQGNGSQTYDGTTIIANNTDSYFYLASKLIEYFHSRSESRMGWLLTAMFAFFSAIISGVIVSNLNVTAIKIIVK